MKAGTGLQVVPATIISTAVKKQPLMSTEETLTQMVRWF